VPHFSRPLRELGLLISTFRSAHTDGLGELSRKEQSDAAGQFVGKRAGGAPKPWRTQERSDDLARVERTLLSAAFDFGSGRTVLQGPTATQPDSSWARGRGAPEPWRSKEAKRRPEPRRRRLPAASLKLYVKLKPKHFGPPEGGPLFMAEARSPLAEARTSLPRSAPQLPASERERSHHSPSKRPAE
jgi:hypothetical protein